MKKRTGSVIFGLTLLAGVSISHISAAADWGAIVGAAMSDPEISESIWIDVEPYEATGPAPFTAHFAPAFLEEQGRPPFQLRWDFGDGTSSTDQKVEHQYENPGEYFVEMLAVDSQGKRIQARKRILVTNGKNEQPFAKIEVEQPYYQAGETVTLDGSNSSDKDGTITDYQWSIDGASGPIQLEIADQPVVSFVMPKDVGPEGLEIKLRIKDDQGAYSAASRLVLALGAVEIISNVSIGLPPMEPSFRIKVNTDEGVHKYTIDYEGDGQYRESASRSDAFTYRYEKAGTYTVIAEVETDSGAVYRGPKMMVLLSKEAETEKIKARWLELTARMMDGDIEGALEYFAESSRSQYRMLFSSMTPEKINAIFGREMVDLNLRSLIEYYAEVGLTTRSDIEGKTVFPLKMLRDPNPDGDWYVLSLM